jgi:hypothetical protein
MYRIETIYLRPQYENDLLERNRDLVGFVVEKGTGKVKKTSIVERNSLGSWYHDNRAQFPEDRFDLLVGSISVIGVLSGADIKDIDAGSTTTSSGNGVKRDPLVYKVN